MLGKLCIVYTIWPCKFQRFYEAEKFQYFKYQYNHNNTNLICMSYLHLSYIVTNSLYLSLQLFNITSSCTSSIQRSISSNNRLQLHMTS